MKDVTRSGEKNVALLIVGPFKHVKPWEKLPLGELELACGQLHV